MTDKTIDQLNDGGKLRPTDLVPVRRGSATLKANLGYGAPLSRRIAVIGTSLVQQNDAASDDSFRISHANRGWLSWLRAYSKGAIECPVWHDETVVAGWEPSGVSGASRLFRGLNFGVSGQTIDQIRARLPYIEANFLDHFTDIVIDGGTNDMGTETKENIQDDREYIATWFLERGKTVHFLPILSREVSSWASGGTQRRSAHWINQKTVEFCQKNFQCFFLDWNAPFVDGGDADGQPKAGYTHDGTHFDNRGGEAVGEFMANYFKPLLPPTAPRVLSNDDIYDATNNPFGCLINNPMLLGTGGNNSDAKVSGDLADGMELEARKSGTTTCVASKEAKANGGEYQVLTFANVDATAQEFYFRTDTTNVIHAMANKWVQASVDIETNDSDAIENVSLVLDDISGTDGNFSEDFYKTGNETWIPKERDLRLITPPILMKADSTTLRIRVVVWIKGSPSVAPVVKISNLEVRQIPDPTF